ncbi:hypothetical protein [Saccharopolyspora taberi]|uniref:hypothetical protein n=1 Tax=Saccharopolyspora taberi TaxID=60895 RepID=UPI0031D88D5F
MVNREVYATTGRVTAAANHVGNWERGVIRWPAASVGALTEWSRPAIESATDLLAAMAGPTQHYRRMESYISSQSLRPAVEAHLRLAANEVEGRSSGAGAFALLSETAGLAAWLAAETGDGLAARRRYTDSIHFAKKANHPLLVSYMTASLGHYAVESGDARSGIGLVQKASAHLDRRAPNSARAWLASLEAVAYSHLRDRGSTIAALRRAEKLASQSGDEPQWPWVFPFTTAKVARYQSTALAALGDRTASETAFSAAAAALTSPKTRALAQLDQALSPLYGKENH